MSRDRKALDALLVAAEGYLMALAYEIAFHATLAATERQSPDRTGNFTAKARKRLLDVIEEIDRGGPGGVFG